MYKRQEEASTPLPGWAYQIGNKAKSSAIRRMVAGAYNADYLKQMQQLFRLDVHLVTEPELPDYADVDVYKRQHIRSSLLHSGYLNTWSINSTFPPRRWNSAANSTMRCV